MDRQITYTLAIDIPINEETTKLYSFDEKLLLVSLNHAMEKIRMIIDKEMFITLERIFRILEFRASPDCPHIIITHLEDDIQFGSGLLTLYLTSGYEVDPVFSSKKIKQQRPSLKLVEEQPEEGEEKWESSTPTETSDSGENEKT